MSAACTGPSAPRAHEAPPPTSTPTPIVDPSIAREVDRGTPVPDATDDRERVAFSRAGSIWMRSGAGEPVQVTVRPLDAPDLDPALSPDGRLLAYSSPLRGTYRLFVVSVDDLIPRNLSGKAASADHHPAWSPDGRILVFMRGDPRVRLDLAIVEVPPDEEGDAPSAPLAALVIVRGDDAVPELVGHPTYSPDGSSIVFSADRREGKGTGLWRYDLVHHTLSRLSPVPTHAGHVIDVDPAFSPDGARIAFASNRHVPSADHDDLEIYSIASDGSGLTRLTDDTGAAREPVYSPDGKRIFFSSTRASQAEFESEVYVMAATGGRARRLTQDERPQNRAPSTALAK